MDRSTTKVTTTIVAPFALGLSEIAKGVPGALTELQFGVGLPPRAPVGQHVRGTHTPAASWTVPGFQYRSAEAGQVNRPRFWNWAMT